SGNRCQRSCRAKAHAWVELSPKFVGTMFIDPNATYRSTDTNGSSTRLNRSAVGAYVLGSNITSFTVRLYYVTQDSINVSAKKGVEGVSPPMTWKDADATARAKVLRDIEVRADDSYTSSSWMPNIPNFNNVTLGGPN